ncbi:hypothetical protein EIB18_03575 [Caulobacter vibrioides]|uniref:UrcA family protein n=3 Tax=Caulobacter vibrioides TaxID=155892 RepID=Q9AAD2_CAUVC|nr:hypothetical protein [Caulobacter vibrioides]YP_002516079.1 hypothetical protein CCNA_00706 [Caulobacter vibrioides NA1000]AAK22655.1 hypothetical protein CC_0670 [Caulobacter vibrioides CB15]ACL94171.1 hypothetical protein CCNA_00706 [Caulobacter vibrioides NA1000]ATC23636.1 hypothetical protein CA608_03360 [Caulobacter vibrioides]ATC27513.1 hypothetical protein CA607_03565 [Caulobacter vibrioides]AZH11884.1 hypothetical protein EIB18_03575 [Caulobacter vibrioides]
MSYIDGGDGRRGEILGAVRGTRREAVALNLLSGTTKMIRMLAIAVTAVMAVSASAANAGEITVKVRGRAAPVVHAEIVSAAQQLCKEDLAGNPKASDLTPYCIREVTRDAVVRAKNPELRAYDKAKGRTAYLRLAAR